MREIFLQLQFALLTVIGKLHCQASHTVKIYLFVSFLKSNTTRLNQKVFISAKYSDPFCSLQQKEQPSFNLKKQQQQTEYSIKSLTIWQVYQIIIIKSFS